MMMFTALKTRLRRLIRETGGVMAVEFALIAPVMIFMMFGMVELTDAILAKRRVGMAVSMLGDLTTNRADDWIHRDELADIFSVSERVLEPYGIDTVTVTVTAATWDDAKNEVVVVWSKKRRPNGQVQNNNDEAYKKGKPLQQLMDNSQQSLGEVLVAEDQHIILAEMSYPFESEMSKVVFKEGFNINVQEVRIPRKRATLRHCNNNKCTDGTDWDEDTCLPKDVADDGEDARCED